MATLKERFSALADRLFDKFDSVAVSVSLVEPGQQDPITGEELAPGSHSGPISMIRPQLDQKAREAFGMATNEFLLVALVRVVPEQPVAHSTGVFVDGVQYELKAVSQDAAGATYRLRCAGGA
jgi:hypothetical protein